MPAIQLVAPIATARLSTVQTLRGLAAMIVVAGHFLSDPSLNVRALKWIVPDPGLGVTVFFVISGFILPWSLWRSRYTAADYLRFVLKRLVRLDPPYFASIVLALLLGYALNQSHFHRGAPYVVSGSQLLLHIGYLNCFFAGKPWIIGVYWTLAIEFQYYLILGLAFSWITSANRLLFAGFVASCAFSQFLIRDRAFLPFNWPVFLMGIVIFRYKARIIQAREALWWILACACWTAFVFPMGLGERQQLALAHAIVGAASALSIAYLEYGNRVLTFFGNISYSLYLLHWPIGIRLVYLGARYARNPVSAVLVALLAMAVSIACAYAMYLFIEKPAMRLEGAIRYAPIRALAAAATSPG